MKTYTIVAFRNKHDVILSRECFRKIGIDACIINAPDCLKTPCSLVLNVNNTPMGIIERAILKCRNAPVGIYNVYEDLNKIRCKRIW